MNSNKKEYLAISYETSTFQDLKHFLAQDNIVLNRISPEEFEQKLASQFQYINLIIQDFETRKKVSFLLDKHKLDRFKYIHSSAVISSDNIGTGIFIYPNCCIYQNSKINSDVIIHANSAIAHNSTVGQGTFISGGVIIAGAVTIGKFCFFGIQSAVIEKLTICDNAVVGAKILIHKNLLDSEQNNRLVNRRAS